MTKMLNYSTDHSANTTLIGTCSFMIEINNENSGIAKI